ncbi:hypothetical protein JW707_02200 [Candidatus Woesearchaeota archaeon]|nr:hypothetical protein [Candidatus Woesearchaeota archaeon]
MSKVVVTFNPFGAMDARGKGFFNPRYGWIAYSELIDALQMKGAPIDYFDDDDFRFMAHEFGDERAVKEYLEERLEYAGLVIHSPHEFNASLISYLLAQNESSALLHYDSWRSNRTTVPEQFLNHSLYDNHGSVSHGLRFPVQHVNEDVKRKDKIPSLAKMLGFDVPPTVVPATAFNHEFYPVFIKHATTTNGRGVYHANGKPELAEALIQIKKKGQRIRDHVVQADISWGNREEGSYSFRALCVSGEAIGVVINYSSGEHITNKGKSYVSIFAPGFPDDCTPCAVTREGHFMHGLKLDGLIEPIQEAVREAEPIAGYCAQKGSQVISVELIRSQVIDVNSDPGSKEFAVQFSPEYAGSGLTNFQVAARVQANYLLEKMLR